MKYIEGRGVNIAPSEIIIDCFKLKSGGSSSVKVSNLFKELLSLEFVEKAGNRYKSILKNRIKLRLGIHEAKTEEIDQVYNHILMEMLK